MDKIYGFLSNEELNKWERLPVVVNILTSKEFGSWLLRRDENRDKQNSSRPQGKKIKKEHYGWVYCSECGSLLGQQDNFCFECGADMRGDKK